jgi:hypothetical protein
VDGTWSLPQGELTLKQIFQNITGTLKSGGVETPVNGKLNGEQISFNAGGAEYSGRVAGNTIDGMIKNGANWTATRK